MADNDKKCNPDDNGKDSDSSNDSNDLEDYDDGEIATTDSPEENQN